MGAPDLTPEEIAELLHRAYQADLGDKSTAPTADERIALADYLGCHPDARDAAWDVWSVLMQDTVIDPDDAEYWLDVEFIDPCPQEPDPS